ncbi:unnamed protein product [Cylindrotheca closterium]|uniref:Uncharacterized protein n=1 Tax=Cylindrotheca closterium TaxID=2856 RepID=A0AAD2CXE5_9STRA|nr:unnamed protein product [Cylindrotheca closterium]
MKASARRASRRRSRPPQTFLGGAANANTNASASKGVPEIMSKLSEEPQDTTMEDQWCDNTSITPLPGQQAQDPGVASARTMSPTPPFSATSAIFSTFSDSFDIPQRRRQQQNYNTINNNNNNNGHDDDDDGGGKEGADDNISVLTDCSWMMDEDEDEYGEEDANSQIAAVSVASESLTVATTTTDSTTLPTNNHLLNQNQHHNHMDPPEPRKKRRQVLSVAHDNGPFKRRKRM